jgi:hypothetical protein
VRDLSEYQPTGNADLDTAWRTAIQDQFAANLAEQRLKTRQLSDLDSRLEEQGGSRATRERTTTSDEPMFVVIDGTWPLPPKR